LPFILDAFGAEGVPRAVATRYLWIVLPSNFIMAAGMALSGLLRAIGDARRAMMVTLIGGIATAFLDPLFIFTFKFGTDGAAIVTIIARLIMLWIGLVGVIGHYQLLIRPTLADMRGHAGALAQVAVPAVLTNVASPVAAGFVLTVVRQFGHEAVAANTIIDRVVPLAFSVVFALSGSVGPILAQNLGAGLHARVRSTLRDSLLFALVYCLIVWAVLAMGRDVIPAIFGASERTAEFIRFYCLIGVAAWIFNALLFVANAAFNNLGFPFYSMLFNWGRASLGTLPFALTGAHLGGYPGLCVGLIIGWGIFGIAAVLTAFRTIARLERQAAPGVSSGRGAG
ncbi:MAG TPA: MATE family efflux transporter, partial [Beijerinckiaceae bacterium]|nr:MATE family efflux transporter [Beijerinckiaceae bacterium]